MPLPMLFGALILYLHLPIPHKQCKWILLIVRRLRGNLWFLLFLSRQQYTLVMVLLLLNIQYVSNQQFIPILPITRSFVSTRIAALPLFIPYMVATIAVTHTIVVQFLLYMVN